MKLLMIPLAFVVSTSAMACPGGSSKDAMATPAAKPAVAQKAANKPSVAAAKATPVKVASKSTAAPETRKLAGL